MEGCSFVEISEKGGVETFLRVEINEKRRYGGILGD